MLAPPRRGAGQPRPSTSSKEQVGGRGKSGLHETRVAGNTRRVRASGLRESATESRPPTEGDFHGKGERVRQERTGGLATEPAWQTPPGARPNRGGASRFPCISRGPRLGCFAPSSRLRPRSGPKTATVRVGCLSLAATQGLEEWLPVRGRSVQGNLKGHRSHYRTRLTGSPAIFSPPHSAKHAGAVERAHRRPHIRQTNSSDLPDGACGSRLR